MTAGPPPLPPQRPAPHLSTAEQVAFTLMILAALQTLLGPIVTRLNTAPGAVPGRTYAVLWAGVGGLWAFAALARRRPFPSAIGALALFLSIWGWDAVTGRIPFAQAIVYKVVVTAILLRTIRNAQRANVA